MNKSFSELYNTWYNLDKVTLSRKLYDEQQKEIDRLSELLREYQNNSRKVTHNYLKEHLNE